MPRTSRAAPAGAPAGEVTPPVRRLLEDRSRGTDPVCLYAYDLDALAGHVRHVVDALPRPFRMFYAMKANTAAPLLRTLVPLVAGFEAASAGEVAKARATDPEVPVIMGGPAKTERDVEEALAYGVTRLHAESVLELHRISAVAARTGRSVDVLLRVNLAGPFPDATLAMAGKPTQFGIEEALLPEAVETARRLPGVELAGFHLHSLSNNLSAAAHLELLRLYRDTVTRWEREFGVTCRVLNVGGGIGVNYADTTRQFDWTAFCEGLRGLRLPGHWQEVDLECGRFLVAGCGWYAAEVLDVKRNHGETYLVLRGGTHHFRLPASWQHSHPFAVLPVDRWALPCDRPEVRDGPVTVVGELCTPKDVLARGVVVPRVRAGDVVVFILAGAYGWEISHHDFLSHRHPEQVFLGGRIPARDTPAREA